MDFAYSPNGMSGGTLHLSPSHHHASDPMAAIRRNLRQSLSRSPSKQRTLYRSPSSSPGTAPLLTTIQVTSPTGKVTYMSPTLHRTASDDAAGNVRKQRLRRTTPLRILERSRAVRSPIRRALSDTNDPNISPPSASQLLNGASGQENNPDGDIEAEFGLFDTARDQSGIKTRGTPLKLNINPARYDADLPFSREFLPIKSSPLKRSDGMMKLNHDNFDNPFVKRRSIQSISAGSSFEAAMDNSTKDNQSALENNNSSDEDSAQSSFSRSLFMPKASPFRRPIHQRAAAARNRRSVEIPVGSPSSKTRSRDKPRTSLDSALSNNQQDSVELFRDSVQSPLEDFQKHQFIRVLRQQPHPLSQTISPTSPTPSRLHDQLDDGKLDQPVRPVNFSKSLPIGAMRPRLRDAKGLSLQRDASNGCATPELYKMARPNPAAFMSTGLISKKHRNVDDMPPPPTESQHEMPDTPCKKLPGTFNISISPSSVKSIAKPRFMQPEFGTPSKPFNPYAIEATPGSFGKSVGIFGSGFFQNPSDRRASFASIESEDLMQALTGGADGQSSADELPPTPTKQGASGAVQKPNSLRSTLLGRRPALGPDTFVSPAPSQSEFPELSFGSSVSLMGPPQTPHDSSFPDPSSLSISPISHTPQSPAFDLISGVGKSLFPATPTGHRDGHAGLTEYPGMTPSNRQANHEVDQILTSRFKKVEWYGRGEFSEVYRVYEAAAPNLPTSSGRQQSGSRPRPDKVWIVKKSKTPYTSNKIRDRRLREAQIMEHLGKHDHIVHFQDSFEADRYLYIQTEFCEEGSLHAFLARTGHKGRLDEFRIWKILIELSQGLKHIHDSNIIHLDLKPANIFIDFEGVLKIGDFGMASTWPAPPDVEGEGDRRYMSPDLLQGRFDKPADIFALGMVLFEIAGNVELPDNGVSWQKLRAGDFSDVPSLTSGSSHSIFDKSQNTAMVIPSIDQMVSDGPQSGANVAKHSADVYTTSCPAPTSGQSFDSAYNDLAQPPSFMLDSEDSEALDKVVKWMMSPEPSERPVVSQILDLGSIDWVNRRRRAGAVVFEGQWGPPNHVLNFEDPDEQMLDI